MDTYEVILGYVIDAVCSISEQPISELRDGIHEPHGLDSLDITHLEYLLEKRLNLKLGYLDGCLKHDTIYGIAVYVLDKINEKKYALK